MAFKTTLSSSVILIFTLFTAPRATAQTPSIPLPGIYTLRRDGDNILGLADYARYIGFTNVSTRSYRINILPESTIKAYNLVYALVAVDTSQGNGLLRIALIRDTVSPEGKKILRALSKNLQFEEPRFSQEFSILQDTVSGQTEDAYFPVNRDIGGKWVFDNESRAIALVQPPVVSNAYHFDSLYQNNVLSQTFNFGQSTFYANYNTGGLFIDLRYTFDQDSIPLHTQPHDHAPVNAWARHDEYLGVLKDSANWLLVVRPVVVADSQRYVTEGGYRPLHTDCRLLRGWINKADLWSPWIKQQQQTRNFRFEVSGSQNEYQDYTNPGQVDALKITNKKSGRQQVIMDIGAELYDSLNNVVQVEDCNFDGYPDIMIYAHNGGAGPNDGYNFYLYQPRSGQFKYNGALSDLTQVEIDTANKIITSGWRDGAAHHGGEQYTFINDTLTKISYWDDYSGWNFAQLNKGKLIDGKWQDSVSYKGTVTVKEADIFSAPEDTARIMGKLLKDNQAVILGESALWFHVTAVNSNGDTIRGWIRKTVLLPQQWLPLKAQTGQYRFAAATADSSSVAAIQVTAKKTNTVVQIIPVYDNLTYTDSLLQTGDYNADGIQDFHIQFFPDLVHPIYDNYIFDAKENLFKADTTNQTQNE